MFPISQFEIHENIIAGISATGNYRKNGLCFAGATSTKRLCIFDTTLSPEQAKSFVKIGQKIQCLLSVSHDDHDCIVIGTDNSVLLFDIDQNFQIFNVLIQDGVYSLLLFNNKTIYVGSNCSLYGYDFSGNEVLWTVTGDIITAMCEIEWDGTKSILLSTKDNYICVFQGEENTRQTKVHSPAIILKALAPNSFVAAFSGGSIAIYNGIEKIWDLAAPDIIGLQIIDFMGTKQNNIAVAYSSGILSILDPKNGQSINSTNTKLNLVGLHLINDQSRDCLAVISSNGSIRIFTPKRTEGVGTQARKELNLIQQQPDLVREKSALLQKEYELKKALGGETIIQQNPNVQILYTLGKSKDGNAIVDISSKPSIPILGTIITCKTTSGVDSVMFEVNDPPSPTQRISFTIPNDSSGKVLGCVFAAGISYNFSIDHPIFFGMDKMDVSQIKAKNSSEGFVEFNLDGVQKSAFSSFVSSNFLCENQPDDFSIGFLSSSINTPNDPSTPKLKSISKEPIIISQSNGKCKIECNKVSTAVGIVNSFCETIKIKEFQCRASFPKEIENLMKSVEEGSEMKNTAAVQRAEIAGIIQQLKDTIIRIENAEEIGDIETVLIGAEECERLNAEAAREHLKRVSNSETKGEGNQKVNAIIQSFAELRKGSFRNEILQLSRRDLQAKDFKKLAYVLEYGHDISSHQ